MVLCVAKYFLSLPAAGSKKGFFLQYVLGIWVSFWDDSWNIVRPPPHFTFSSSWCLNLRLVHTEASAQLPFRFSYPRQSSYGGFCSCVSASANHDSLYLPVWFLSHRSSDLPCVFPSFKDPRGVKFFNLCSFLFVLGTGWRLSNSYIVEPGIRSLFFYPVLCLWW